MPRRALLDEATPSNAALVRRYPAMRPNSSYCTVTSADGCNPGGNARRSTCTRPGLPATSAPSSRHAAARAPAPLGEGRNVTTAHSVRSSSPVSRACSWNADRWSSGVWFNSTHNTLAHDDTNGRTGVALNSPSTAVGVDGAPPSPPAHAANKSDTNRLKDASGVDGRWEYSNESSSDSRAVHDNTAPGTPKPTPGWNKAPAPPPHAELAPPKSPAPTSSPASCAARSPANSSRRLACSWNDRLYSVAPTLAGSKAAAWMRCDDSSVAAAAAAAPAPAPAPGPPPPAAAGKNTGASV